MRLRYRINGGRVRTTGTDEWDGGERSGEAGDVHSPKPRCAVSRVAMPEGVSTPAQRAALVARAMRHLGVRGSGGDERLPRGGRWA